MSFAFTTALVVISLLACSDAAPSGHDEKREAVSLHSGTPLENLKVDLQNLLMFLKPLIIKVQRLIRQICPKVDNGGYNGMADYSSEGNYNPQGDYFGDNRPPSYYGPPRTYRDYVSGAYKVDGDYNVDGSYKGDAGKENPLCPLLEAVYKVLENIKNSLSSGHGGKQGSGNYDAKKVYY
ncbi:hypothetical protein Bpfe_013928 [Biomphalaria pfeifferi]|uniref:Uncharacterized protein n=1 Tax=Biomphalaria pfeifferi TaxID=112525 RepID=A0AAD8BLC1_BIOPF|nr:hypothetical protein Bpfe_013928 [Biomphalaria pfeifferi]